MKVYGVKIDVCVNFREDNLKQTPEGLQKQTAKALVYTRKRGMTANEKKMREPRYGEGAPMVFQGDRKSDVYCV